jgi:hypothetical protein
MREEESVTGRIIRLRLTRWAVAEATFSSLVLATLSQTIKQQFCCYSGEDGASGRITRLRLTLRAVAEATLSSLVPAKLSQNMK